MYIPKQSEKSILPRAGLAELKAHSFLLPSFNKSFRGKDRKSRQISRLEMRRGLRQADEEPEGGKTPRPVPKIGIMLCLLRGVLRERGFVVTSA